MYPNSPYETFHDIIDKYNSTVDSPEDKIPKIPFHGLRQTSTTMKIYAHTLKELDVRTADAFVGIIQKKA